MRIGEFGAAKRELAGERDDFVFCGEVFVIHQQMPAVLMLQLGASATGKIDETEGFAAIWEAMRISLTVPSFKRQPPANEVPGDDGLVEVPENSEQFNRWYKLAVSTGQELEPLMRLVMALFEAQSGRPTGQALDSSAGPSTTSPSSSVSSTRAAPSALAHLRPVGDMNGASLPDPAMVRMVDGSLASYTPATAEDLAAYQAAHTG